MIFLDKEKKKDAMHIFVTMGVWSVELDAIVSAITFRKRCEFFENTTSPEYFVFFAQEEAFTETLSCLHFTNVHLFSFEAVKKWLKSHQREVWKQQ